MSLVNIEHLTKAQALKALYDNALCFDMKYYIPGSMRLSLAKVLIDSTTRNGIKDLKFSHCQGRMLKVDLEGYEFDATEYDLHNGKGTAQRAIDSIK